MAEFISEPDGEQETGGHGGELPHLVVFYEPQFVSPLALAQSASGRCRLLWVFDDQTSGPTDAQALLRRLGPVAEVSSSDLDQAAAVVARYRPIGLLALADAQLVFAALLAERIGLPYVTPEVARCLTDKHAQRHALAASGVSVPGFALVPRSTETGRIAKFASTIQYPAVLKPRRGSGSEYTELALNADQLVAVLSQRSNSLGDLVVEEYLADGIPREEQVFADYVSVESAVTGGQIRHLSVTGCFPLAEPFRETGNFMPSALTSEQTAPVLAEATAALEGLRVMTGVMHTEIKLTPAGPRVIEVNGRIGGDTPALLRLSVGLDMFGIAMDIALDRHVVVAPQSQFERVGYAFQFQAPLTETRLGSIAGLQHVGELPQVESVTLNRQPGARLDWREGTYGYIYSVIGSVPDHATLIRRLSEIVGLVNVTYG